MSIATQEKHLFTASQVARFCQVDLKTIHNWADRGEIPHFRTPGRHLRFRRGDVLDFLRRYGYPIPPELGDRQPRVVLLLSKSLLEDGIVSALEPSFAIEAYSEPAHALLSIGAHVPDAVVLADDLEGLSAIEVIAALKKNQHTRHVRAVLFGSGEAHASKGANGTHVYARTADALLETLEAMMGVERSAG